MTSGPKSKPGSQGHAAGEEAEVPKGVVCPQKEGGREAPDLHSARPLFSAGAHWPQDLHSVALMVPRVQRAPSVGEKAVAGP